MRLLLDRHGEFLQARRVEPALAQDACELAGEGAFVRVAGEERDRLATLSTATCIKIVASQNWFQRKEGGKLNQAYLFAQSGEYNPQSSKGTYN